MRAKPPITVMYENRAVTLRELSILTGLGHGLLKRRYQDGDRDERLWRPRENTFAGMKVEQLAEETHRKQILVRQQCAQAKRDAREAVRQRRLAERDAELRRPLIDANLLLADERREIRTRVVNSGQRNWGLKGTQV